MANFIDLHFGMVRYREAGHKTGYPAELTIVIPASIEDGILDPATTISLYNTDITILRDFLNNMES
jgi:hypothetical protein